jgi:hypothetical protein
MRQICVRGKIFQAILFNKNYTKEENIVMLYMLYYYYNQCLKAAFTEEYLLLAWAQELTKSKK